MKTQVCDNYYISRSQRETEVARGVGEKGTLGYEERGCFECDGLNSKCQMYSDYLGGVEEWNNQQHFLL